MRILTILFLSCLAAFATDEEIRILTSTNRISGEDVSVYEAYLRGGETNLIRNTRISTQGVQDRIHRFYYDGQYLGAYVSGRKSSGCITEPTSQFMLAFAYGSSNELKAVIVGRKDGQIVDAFGCTNGVLAPVSITLIQNANRFGLNMKSFIHVESIRRHLWGEAISDF
jgi:hypothetical protein